MIDVDDLNNNAVFPEQLTDRQPGACQRCGAKLNREPLPGPDADPAPPLVVERWCATCESLEHR